MDFRSIDRLFGSERVIRRFNKKEQLNLKHSTVFIMYALYRCSKKLPCSLKQIGDFLASSCRTYNNRVIQENINYFIGEGWVKKSEKSLPRYSVTVLFLVTLNDIEKALKSNRTDKLLKRKLPKSFRKQQHYKTRRA